MLRSLVRVVYIDFLVMCGAASCTDVLIQHVADITALDGAGVSAVPLAKKNVILLLIMVLCHGRRLTLKTSEC